MVGYAQILQRVPQEWRMTFLELTEAMEQHLREQLAVRREDFIALSDAVRDLVRAQARSEAEWREYRAQSEERFARIEAAIQELTAAQARTEQRIAELAAAQARTEAELREYRAQSEERFARLEAAIQELRDAQARTEQTLQALIAVQQKFEERLQRLETRMGRIEGRLLEMVYRERATSYFGRVLRRPKVVDLSAILDDLEARLSPDEVDELLNLDLLVTGRPRWPQEAVDQPDIWLAVEVSSTVDVEDVTRAVARSALLRKAGYPAIPTAAGQELTIPARTIAQEEAVLILQDGRVLLWEEALARLSGPRASSPPSPGE
ncbi:MAG: hypothetical protein H5T61_13085 [Thermoflexales bacterium]|nr:hypothetical protein [Thermoflexales bacterium]